MSTKLISLESIFLLAREALLKAGANQEHADAVADTVMRLSAMGRTHTGFFGYQATYRHCLVGKSTAMPIPKWNHARQSRYTVTVILVTHR